MGVLAPRAALAFLVWTVTSFLCHHCAKVFLRTAGAGPQDGILWAAILTGSQAVACFLLTEVRVPGDWLSPEGRVFLVKASTHVLATLATNYSLACMQAASTMAVKLLEPLTSALVQWLVLGLPLSPAGLASLPLVVAGAAVFVGGPGGGTGGSQALGAGLALASNLLLAARNVAVKMEQQGDRHGVLRGGRPLVVTLAAAALPLPCLLYLQTVGPWGASALPLYVACCLSSLFHVAYSHVSTSLVLRQLTVVSHAVANILKRLLVVLLLYAVGQRTATLGNFLGLLLCILGLALYVWGKLNPLTADDKAGKTKMRAAVLAALLCVAWLGSTAILPQFYVTGSRAHAHAGLSRSVLALAASADVTLPEDVFDIRLTEHPLQADAISPYLTNPRDIIAESQRVHLNIFSDLLSQYRYAVLLDVAAFENKGDPAITAGEVYLLQKLDIQVLYYCSSLTCTDENLAYARHLASHYSPESLVVLIHGGGNLVGYEFNDYLRQQIFQLFKGYHKVIFPQSVYLKENSQDHLVFCKELYSKTENLTMVLRDRLSFTIAERLFRGKPRFLMAPDMAFQIGEVPRFMPPMYDILWLKRGDAESPEYKVPAIPNGLSVRVADWWKWRTPKGKNSLENAILIATNGLLFLQRGRVVITDRLHGHILCTLLNIPHVLIDNRYHKLSSYHNTWTLSSNITLVAKDAQDALLQAVRLLVRLDAALPSLLPFMDVREVKAAVVNRTALRTHE